MKMHTSNITELNLEKLKLLFPALITEARDADGKIMQSFDFDLFRQEFSSI